MINSRDRGKILKPAAALIGSILGAFLGLAPVFAADPDPAAPTKAGDAPSLQRAILRPGAKDAPVEYGTLNAPDLTNASAVDHAEGGLSPSMWDGSSAANAASLLQNEPRATRSLALQGLARRILLSEARPPRGAFPEGTGLLSLRLERLLALGDFDSVLQLSNPILPSAEADRALRSRAEAYLLRGDEQSACGLAQRMRMVVTDPYWVKLSVYCDVRAGNVPSAELAVGLLKSQGVSDPAFYDLYDWLVIPPSQEKPRAPAHNKAKKHAKAAPKPPAPRTPPKGDGTVLSFMMLRAAKLPLAEGALTLGRPAMLHALALAPAEKSASPDPFAAAAEAAFLGAFPTDPLRELCKSATIPMDALSNPISASSGLPPAQALAVLYQSVKRADSAQDQVHRAVAAYQAAQARGQGGLFATLVLPDLRRLAPDPGLAPEIPGVVEVLLAGGDVPLAYSWFGLVDQSTGTSRLDHLSNLLRIARPSERLPFTPEIVKQQLDRAALSGSAAMAQRSFEIRVLESLGYALSPEIAAVLPPALPDGGENGSAFREAVTGRRTAEAVLLSFNILGTDGPARAQPAQVIDIVKGFSALGLDQDARAIGLEAALASIALHP